MGIVKAYFRITKNEFDKLSSIKSHKELDEILKDAKEIFDIDQSWEILNYLITGEKYFSNHPFTKVIYPDNFSIQISEDEKKLIDDYYYNSRQDETEKIREILLKQELSQGFVNPDEVAEVISKLEQIDIEQIMDNADFDTFNEIGIYPETWDNSTEHKEYVREHFNNLFSFLQRAKEDEDWVIVENQ